VAPAEKKLARLTLRKLSAFRETRRQLADIAPFKKRFRFSAR